MSELSDSTEEQGITIEPGYAVTATSEVPFAAEAAWGFVGDFAGVGRWHPLVVRCETHGGAGSLVRKVDFADWWVEEKLDQLDPLSMTIAYSIVGASRSGMTGASARIVLTSLAPDRTRIDWSVRSPTEIPDDRLRELGRYYHLRIGQLRAAVAAAA